jgi:hypothetical protein
MAVKSDSKSDGKLAKLRAVIKEAKGGGEPQA